MAAHKQHLSQHLAKLNADPTFGGRPTATTNKKRRRTDEYEDEEDREIIVINDRYSYEFVQDPHSTVTLHAQDLLRQGRMPSSAKIIPSLGTVSYHQKGVRCIVLYHN